MYSSLMISENIESTAKKHLKVIRKDLCKYFHKPGSGSLEKGPSSYILENTIQTNYFIYLGK